MTLSLFVVVFAHLVRAAPGAMIDSHKKRLGRIAGFYSAVILIVLRNNDQLFPLANTRRTNALLADADAVRLEALLRLKPDGCEKTFVQEGVVHVTGTGSVMHFRLFFGRRHALFGCHVISTRPGFSPTLFDPTRK